MLISSTADRKISLEDWLQNPVDNTEWVNGELVEKHGMTLKRSRVQSRLVRYWGNYVEANGIGGEVYTEVPCRTNKRGRIPDVAYLTPELVEQYGDEKVLPQSFPLIAEIVSPTDSAEELFDKVNEYHHSGSLEVWLVLPESRWIIVIGEQQQALFAQGAIASTQIILQGFSIAVTELLA